MPSLAELLPAALQGARQSQQDIAQRNAGDLQQATGVMSLAGLLQQQQAQQLAAQREQAFRGELQALGPNPDQATLAAVAAKYTTPKDLLDTQQKSLDRKATMDVTAATAAERVAAQREAAQARLEQQGQFATQMHEFRMANAKTNEERAAEAARHNTSMEGLQRLMLQVRGESAGQAQGLREQGLEIQRQRLSQQGDQQTNNQIGAFTNHLQQNKIPSVVASITTANDLLRKYESGDIPGFGLVTGSSKLPNAFRTEEANNVRSTVQAVTNDLLNMYSGLAVTLPESDRRDLEQMKGGDFSSQDFKNAWPRIVNRANAVVGNLKAGLPPAAVEAYRARPGAINLDPIRPAFGSKSVMDAADAILKGGKP